MDNVSTKIDDILCMELRSLTPAISLDEARSDEASNDLIKYNQSECSTREKL